MINKVILVGRITRDPELKYTPNGIAYVQFTLAVNRPFVNRDGNRDTDFINCTAWRGQAENLSRYIRKGALLGVEGSLQVNSFDDSQGMRR
ncbi:MAG TPA: single-stranded DNA-binding protein, partial [Bacilli bacterium]|nr:single-stranded DNA-binding protein [Bacilli bacterium]